MSTATIDTATIRTMTGRTAFRTSVSAPACAPATPRTTAAAGHLRLTRRGRVVLTALVSVPVALGALFLVANAGQAAATAPSAASDHAHFHYVTVHDGQSLWSIAERVAPHADPRDVIADIVALNQLHTGNVVPGERLAIPLQYEPAAE